MYRLITLILLFCGFFTTAFGQSRSLIDAQTELEELGVIYSLGDLETLPWLDLSDQDLSKTDLTFLKALRSLEKLDLRNAKVGNNVLKPLSSMDHLRVVWLQGTQVNEKGIKYLSQMHFLDELYLPRNFPNDKVEILREKLPNTNVEGGEIINELGSTLYWMIAILLIVALSVIWLVFKKAKFLKTRGKKWMLIGGIYLFIVFVILLVNAIHFMSVSIYANGRVVEMIARTSSDEDGTSTAFHPYIEFTDQKGDRYGFESDYGSNPPSYEKGEPVEVMYDPENPSNAELHSTGGIIAVYSYPFMFLIFSLIISGSAGALKPVKRKINKLLNKKRVVALKMLQDYNVDTNYEQLSNKYYCRLDFTGKQVKDEDLKLLDQVRHLTNLCLNNTRISDIGLSHLVNQKHLVRLELNGTKITNEGLRYLIDLPALESLYLENTRIDGNSVQYIKQMSKLETLEVSEKSISDRELEALEAALPDLTIWR